MINFIKKYWKPIILIIVGILIFILGCNLNEKINSMDSNYNSLSTSFKLMEYYGDYYKRRDVERNSRLESFSIETKKIFNEYSSLIKQLTDENNKFRTFIEQLAIDKQQIISDSTNAGNINSELEYRLTNMERRLQGSIENE